VSAADAGGRQPLGAEAMDICFEAWYGTHEGGTDHRHLALAAWRQGVALAATIASASLAAARAERDAARDALRFYADPASWEGRDDYIEGEHVERFDPEAFDDKGTRARAALAARPPAAPSGAPASDARPAPGRAEARTYEDGIDAAVAAVLARYDICARNHEAATYLTHGKISDDEPTLDRMEWAARRSEAMKCRDAIRALAAAPPAPATRECCPTCRSNTRAWRGTIPYHSAQSGIQIGTMACDDVWHDAAEAPAPGREGAK
jgi:hypothetical protein